MAGILKKVFRVFNGTDWDKYHFETDSEQVIHGDTTVKASIDELNSSFGDGAALKVKSDSNLIYGCYTAGIYYYGGNAIGAPSAYSGVMITFRESSTSNMIKIAFSIDGRMYRMTQKIDGTVSTPWGYISFTHL